MREKLGAAMKDIPIEFVLTVPAVWSEAAKVKTLEACRAAGFGSDGPILLVSEPVNLLRSLTDA